MPGAIVTRATTAAPAVVGPSTTTATRPSKPLPQYLIDTAKLTKREDFDASTHLNFQAPKNIISMKDIGFEGHGISPNAVSEPFSLFTPEAIQQIRAEVFGDEAVRDCQFTSTFSKYMIRGMGPKRAPFTYAAWNSPELISKISQVAGVELVPSIDFEIANINISVSEEPAENSYEVKGKDQPLGDDISAFAWHYDSFPFVCVVMLSDCTGMVGGETALRTSSGEIMKVRGPAMGTAVMLQGRYIEHQALKALGGRERISMVTCFRPKSPLAKDETVLTGVRAISYKSELYSQYFEYRLEILEERIRAKAKAEKLRERAAKSFNTAEARDWLMDQKEFIEAMLYEITDE
ncbi:hypothetical protein QQS21_002236 [Conoideocrella luteorostrata]|uniref:Fe2OG dioxygenase domain-containing protein n=1 Tax=Conoideocrella luteorostrata TaxID=1105319 RepID=A0AAJ0G1F3_9HYPO|nr:hypothetical protein QQS21_002236 [Conoideocrella luteorostrata]